MAIREVRVVRKKCFWNQLFHCVKNVQIWSYFWSVFSPNTGKYRPDITPYLDTFHAVLAIALNFLQSSTICQIHLFQSFTFSWFPRRLLPDIRFKNLSQVITIIRSRRNLERAMLVSKRIEKVMSACIKLLLFSLLEDLQYLYF